MTLPELKMFLQDLRHHARYGRAGQEYVSVGFLNDRRRECGNLMFFNVGEKRVVVFRLSEGKFMVMITDSNLRDFSIWIPYTWTVMFPLLEGQMSNNSQPLWGWKVSGF